MRRICARQTLQSCRSESRCRSADTGCRGRGPIGGGRGSVEMRWSSSSSRCSAVTCCRCCCCCCCHRLRRRVARQSWRTSTGTVLGSVTHLVCARISLVLLAGCPRVWGSLHSENMMMPLHLPPPRRHEYRCSSRWFTLMVYSDDAPVGVRECERGWVGCNQEASGEQGGPRRRHDNVAIR